MVKRSKINKRGVFAARDFKKGDIVLKWHPKILTRAEVAKLPRRLKHDVDQVGKNTYVLQRPPERFVNHSCEANTRASDQADVARRNIREGEEIMSDYGRGILVAFKCNCRTNKCRGDH